MDPYVPELVSSTNISTKYGFIRRLVQIASLLFAARKKRVFVKIEGKTLRTKRVSALSIKPGPTESGTITTPTPTPRPVGGTVVPVDKLLVFLSNFWPIMLLLLLPAAFILYKKRNLVLKMLSPVIFRFL